MSEERFYDVSNEERKSRILGTISEIINDEDIKTLMGYTFFLTVKEHDGKEYSYARSDGILNGQHILQYMIEKGIFQQVVTT